MNCPEASVTQDASSVTQDKEEDSTNAGLALLGNHYIHHGARVRHFSGCGRTFSCHDEAGGSLSEGNTYCFELRERGPPEASRQAARQADWAASAELMLRSQAEANAAGVDRTGPRTWDLSSDAGVMANCRLVSRATYACDPPADVVPASR
jgi:hypothetical protein